MSRITPLTPPPLPLVELDDDRALTLGPLVGTGSHASVFRATIAGSSGVKRLVAVKLFDVVASEERDVVVPRLIKAVRHTAALRHPNVVAIHEFGNHAGRQPFVVSDLVDGRPLSALIEGFEAKGERLPPDLALFIGIEVAEALSGARYGEAPAERGSLRDTQRSHRVIHGDLSAREVLLSFHGEVKISDFGVNLAMSSGSRVRSRSAIAQRVVTLSPEVAHGEKADQRSDVFSLGALLHLMLIGPRFAKEDADEQVLARVMQGSFDPVLFGPQPPDAIRAIVARATHPDPDRRFDEPAILAYELRKASMKLGVGDGRVFLRHALQAVCGRETVIDADMPTAPEGAAVKALASKRKGKAAGEA